MLTQSGKALSKDTFLIEKIKNKTRPIPKNVLPIIIIFSTYCVIQSIDKAMVWDGSLFLSYSI